MNNHMNVDRVLETLNARQVRYLLIGGVNYGLRHAPVLTYDLDVWIEDTAENLRRCEEALAELHAEWGRVEDEWKPVAELKPGWLTRQGVFCLTSPHAAIDVFRSVEGLTSWAECHERAVTEHTASGVAYAGLSDDDMLQCQLALPEEEQNRQRIRDLRRLLGGEDES